jgi:RNA 2',3'-cyclic 3'-phosphodiesterase
VEPREVSSETRQTMPRLFIAIRPPAPIRAQLLSIQGGIDGARWQDDDQLHLTLRFIGDVDPRTGDDIAEALETVHARPLAIALNGIGSFDRKGRIDTLWAGVKPHDALAALHKKIDHALVRLGLPPERRAYVPHITIARFGRMAGPIDGFAKGYAGLSSADALITEFALVESILQSGGASYHPIATYALS